MFGQVIMRGGAARLAVADEMERMKLTRTLCARSLAEWRDATRAAGHVTKVMIGFTTAAAPSVGALTCDCGHVKPRLPYLSSFEIRCRI